MSARLLLDGHVLRADTPGRAVLVVIAGKHQVWLGIFVVHAQQAVLTITALAVAIAFSRARIRGKWHEGNKVVVVTEASGLLASGQRLRVERGGVGLQRVAPA